MTSVVTALVRKLLQALPVPVLLLIPALLVLLLQPARLMAADAPDQAARPGAPAQRIIALAPHIVELLFAIGAGDRIIGTTSYADYPEQAKTIPQVGSYAGLQVEKILQLKPDLVIAWRTGNPPADLARLHKYGIPVVYSEMRNLDDVASELLLFGELTGQQATAATLAADYRQQLQQLRQQYQQRTPVRVFYELWSRPLTTVAANAWPQQQLAVCGAENPFADSLEDYPQVSLEQVVATNPQAIIQPDKHGQQSADSIDWQRWPQLGAVQHQAILHPDADKVHRMTPRTLPELALLCEQIDRVRQDFP